MKKSFCTIILAIIFQALYAESKPTVVCTASMISDMAKNIIGDKAEIKLIVPIGGDPHMYEPTPTDAELVNHADLILKNGMTFEGWLNKLIENSGTKADVVQVTKGINAISSLVYENAKDPHAWMDVGNAIIYAENIAEAAKKLMPESSEYLDENLKKYKAELQETDAYILKRIQEIPESRRVLITSHDAFQYYGEKYGIELVSTMGTSTDADVQTSDINMVYKKIRETGIPAIFVESTVNPKLIKQIAKDLNVVIGGKLYADSIGEKGSPGDTYIKMMKSNTDKIVEALSKEVVAEKIDGTGDMKMVYGLLGIIVFLGALFLFIRKKNS